MADNVVSVFVFDVDSVLLGKNDDVATAFSRDWTCVIETWKVVRAFK